MTLRRFPGAPLDSEITEQGWLIVADECWTAEEWSHLTAMQRRAITGDVPLWDETPGEVKRRHKRELDRLSRAARRAA